MISHSLLKRCGYCLLFGFPLGELLKVIGSCYRMFWFTFLLTPIWDIVMQWIDKLCWRWPLLDFLCLLFFPEDLSEGAIPQNLAILAPEEKRLTFSMILMILASVTKSTPGKVYSLYPASSTSFLSFSSTKAISFSKILSSRKRLLIILQRTTSNWENCWWRIPTWELIKLRTFSALGVDILLLLHLRRRRLTSLYSIRLTLQDGEIFPKNQI